MKVQVLFPIRQDTDIVEKLTPKVLDGLEPFDVVEVYFSSKGAVTKLVKKEGSNVTDMMP